MDERGGEPSPEAEIILKKIVEDFEQLDRAIEEAILRLEEGEGGGRDIETLLRALEAVRRGAELARDKVGSG